MGLIREGIATELRRYARFLGNMALIEAALLKAGLMEVDGWVDATAITCEEEAPRVCVDVDNTPELISSSAKSLTSASDSGRIEKSFNEESNQLRLTGTVLGVEVTIAFTPPSTCTVEKVEEEVQVEEKVIPAHVEKKVRFRLVGDCGPMLAAGGEANQAASAAAE